MITVRKVDVAGRIDELLERVAAGDEVQILDGSIAVARLVAAAEPKAAATDEVARARLAAIARARAAMPGDMTLEELLSYRDEGRR